MEHAARVACIELVFGETKSPFMHLNRRVR
jgi:hypothetical protein